MSLDGRAMNVIVSMAALATLLLGFASFARGNTAIHLGPLASAFVGTAVIVFALAAVEALRSLLPRAYRGPTASSLREVADKYMAATAVQAVRTVMNTRIRMIEQAKYSNGLKADRLENAMRFEIGGAAVLGTGVILVLLGA